MRTTLEQADAYMASCKKCGACCQRTIMELDVTDLVREPKLRPFCSEFKDTPASFLLAHPCPFLRRNQCLIYATRPHNCVSAVPGDSHCCPVDEIPDETEHKIFTEE